jgi:hypothetical protein
MAYDPATDFIALSRQTSGGMRSGRMPGLDYVLAAMERAGMFTLHTGQTAPTTNQAVTVWLKPALQSWTAESSVFLWNAATVAYEPATPALWNALLAPATQVLQDVVDPGPAVIQLDANIVRVNQTVSAPITLLMPLSSAKVGNVLISDWKADAGMGNTITAQLAGGDVFPGGGNTWDIAGNGGSIFLRPVPGGYAL